MIFGFLFRMFLIGLVLYVGVKLAWGGYAEIRNYYWWMHPL